MKWNGIEALNGPERAALVFVEHHEDLSRLGGKQVDVRR